MQMGVTGFESCYLDKVLFDKSFFIYTSKKNLKKSQTWTIKTVKTAIFIATNL